MLHTDSSGGTQPRVGSQGAWVPLSKLKPPSPREKAEITKDRGSEKDTLRGAVGGAKSVEIKETSVRTKVRGPYHHPYHTFFFFFFLLQSIFYSKQKIQVQNITYNLKREKYTILHSEHSKINNFI